MHGVQREGSSVFQGWGSVQKVVEHQDKGLGRRQDPEDDMYLQSPEAHNRKERVTGTGTQREKSARKETEERNKCRWDLRSAEERHSRRIRDVTTHRVEKLESSVGPWRCQAALPSVSL